MAATKTTATLQASGSNAAGATATGTAVNLTTTYGSFVTGLITNGATAPTLPCTCVIQTSMDNTTFRDTFVWTGSTVASGITYISQAIDPGVLYVRTKFTGNTGQAVTIAAEIGTLATI